MPQIREFNNPITGLEPNDRAVSSAVFRARHTEAEFAYAGQQIGGGIKDIGAAYDRIKTQQDISHGLATAADMQSNLTTAWDVTINNADPNDHSVAEKWREENLNPALDAWQQGFSTEEGRQWAAAHAGALRQHFFEKTAADQSIMAGQASVSNLNQFKIGMSNTVTKDPTALNQALGTVDAAIEATIQSTPGLDPRTTAELRGSLRDQWRKEIATSAVKSIALANPDEAMKRIAGGEYNQILDGTDQEALFGYAQELHRQADRDAKAQVEMTRQQQGDDFKAKVAALSASMFAPDGSLQIPPNFHQALTVLSTHPGAVSDPGAIRALGDAAAKAVENANTRTFQTTDPQTWRDLAGRIGAPPGSPNELTRTMVDREYANGNLSNTDYHFLHGAVESAKADPAANKAMTQLNQALTRVKPLVDHSNLYSGKLDQSGIALYDDLHYDTFQKYNQLIAGGKTPQQAVDILTDPRNPQGIQQNLSPYQTNNKAGLAAIHARVSAGGGPTNVAAPNLTAARKPGETAEQYLQRVGK